MIKKVEISNEETDECPSRLMFVGSSFIIPSEPKIRFPVDMDKP